MKRTICIDFDGVIHDYREGWKDGTIYGKVTPGFFKWADEMRKHYRLAIHSSRSATQAGRDAIKDWLMMQWGHHCTLEGNRHIEVPIFWDSIGNLAWFDLPADKPPAVVYIDDRAVHFNGHWSDPQYGVEAIRNFEPWMRQS